MEEEDFVPIQPVEHSWKIVQSGNDLRSLFVLARHNGAGGINNETRAMAIWRL